MLFKVGIERLVILLALIRGEKAGGIFGEVRADEEPCDECLLDEFLDDVVVVGLDEAVVVVDAVVAFKAGEFEDEVAVLDTAVAEAVPPPPPPT